MFSSDLPRQKVKVKGNKDRRSAFCYCNKYLKQPIYKEKMFIALHGPDVLDEVVCRSGDNTQGNNTAHFVAEEK